MHMIGDIWAVLGVIKLPEKFLDIRPVYYKFFSTECEIPSYSGTEPYFLNDPLPFLPSRGEKGSTCLKYRQHSLSLYHSDLLVGWSKADSIGHQTTLLRIAIEQAANRSTLSTDLWSWTATQVSQQHHKSLSWQEFRISLGFKKKTVCNLTDAWMIAFVRHPHVLLCFHYHWIWWIQLCRWRTVKVA